MAKKDEAPDYTDGTWYVPAGKSTFEKKPKEELKKEKADAKAAEEAEKGDN